MIKTDATKQKRRTSNFSFRNAISYCLVGIVLLSAVVATLNSEEIATARAAQITQQERQQAEQRAAQQQQAAQRAAKRAACQQDIHCAGSKHVATAHIKCAFPIERLAKYSHEWTDTGWFEQKFTQFRWKGKPNVITYFGDKLKFQNGFGAWRPMTYSCDVNVETEQVLAVRATPGRLS